MNKNICDWCEDSKKEARSIFEKEKYYNNTTGISPFIRNSRIKIGFTITSNGDNILHICEDCLINLIKEVIPKIGKSKSDISE